MGTRHDDGVKASVSFILVRPVRPANVGAAARALKNFGFDDLRIVGECDALPGGAGHPEARALAWNAADVLERARPFVTLQGAVADLHVVAAASGRVEPGRDTLTPRELAAEVGGLPAGQRAGCVFGPEDHGLSNVELDECRVRLRIPTASEQPSLNLAQAVVVVAYEMAQAAAPHGELPVAPDEPSATEGDVARLTAAARDLLLRAGYLNPQGPEHVLGELRRLLSRARPTAREVHLLQALVAQLDWAHRERP